VLTFYEADGDSIITFSNKSKDNKLEPKKGNNHFQWNTNYPSAERFEGMILWWASLQGPKAIPGDYKVVLNVNGIKQTQNFTILQNPTSESSLADVKEQFDFVQSINKKVDEAHKAIVDIRTLRTQFEDYKKKTEDKNIIKQINTIDSLMTDVEKNIYQTKNRSGQDPLNYPIRLTNKLAHINALATINTGDYKPTSSMYEVRDILLAELNTQLSKWIDIKSDMIPNLNNAIREKMVDTFILKSKK
jgi:hypothetical protein